MERWKTLTHKGTDWIVSDLGNVRIPERLTKVKRTRDSVAQSFGMQVPERQVAKVKTRSGYHEVAVMVSGKRIKALVHRLVGLAWVDGYAEGLTINHIDGVKTNNVAANLEWVSLADNTRHEWGTGLVNLRGENQPLAKLTSKRVVYIRRLLRQGVSAHALAIVADVSPSTIGFIAQGKRWRGVG